MPPTTFPPTPAPSTDIKGRDSGFLAPIDTAFALPPSAVAGNHNHDAPAASNSGFSSPLSPTHSNKPSSNSSDVSLPPPPSRSRKIIQVKPKGSSEERDATYAPSLKPPKGAAKETGKRKSAAAGGSGTAAGRKVARKTAHSIIERRRRSKMNEEFGVLKDLIPACRGCEMHKLAILQASIDYLRYLENCVSELKAGRATSSEAPSLPSNMDNQSDDEAHPEADDAEDDASDDEMEMGDTRSPSHLALQHDGSPGHALPAAHTAAASSTAGPLAHGLHRASTSSTATSALQSPYFGPVSSHTSQTVYSNTTSPIFGPYHAASATRPAQHARHPSSTRASISHSVPHSHLPPLQAAFAHQPLQSYSRSGSAHTSPVIYPQHQGLNEAEASTALLMLNQDRGVRPSASKFPEKRGMSVKDLLSG